MPLAPSALFDVIAYCGTYDKSPSESFGVVPHDSAITEAWMVHTSRMSEGDASALWRELVAGGGNAEARAELDLLP